MRRSSQRSVHSSSLMAEDPEFEQTLRASSHTQSSRRPLLLVNPGSSLFAQQQRSLLRHAPPGVMKPTWPAPARAERFRRRVQQWMHEQREQPPSPQDYAQAQPHDAWQQQHHHQQPAPAYPPQQRSRRCSVRASARNRHGPARRTRTSSRARRRRPACTTRTPATTRPTCARTAAGHASSTRSSTRGQVAQGPGRQHRQDARPRRGEQGGGAAAARGRAAAAERKRIAAEHARHAAAAAVVGRLRAAAAGGGQRWVVRRSRGRKGRRRPGGRRRPTS